MKDVSRSIETFPSGGYVRDRYSPTRLPRRVLPRTVHDDGLSFSLIVRTYVLERRLPGS